jgi:hypothetical protein
MVRRRKKLALYEVISKARLKPHTGKPPEPLHSEKADERAPTTTDSTLQAPEKIVAWPRKPRIVQLNAGRVEFSMPYQLAVAILLIALVLALVLFRLGQIYQQRIIDSAANPPQSRQPAAPRTRTRPPAKPTTAENTSPPAASRTVAVDSRRNHRIVIKQCRTRRDLEPVQKFFAAKGIETVIEKRGSRFFLVTKDLFENTKKRETDGYTMKQKIVKVGAGYKAPQGYESFAPRLFSDAYGEKIR